MISTFILLFQIGMIIFIKRVLTNHLNERIKYIDSLYSDDASPEGTRKDNKLLSIETSILLCKILIGFCVANRFIF